MEYMKFYREAGKPTIAAPIYLCEKAREQLENWQRLPVEQMQAEIKESIESLDRFEFLAVDEGQIKAMMIIAPDYDPHFGSYLATKYSFSPNNKCLFKGYRWMKKIAKMLELDGVLISRQISGDSIIKTFKRFKDE
ncbi:hypothetical protein IFY90_004259 [Salmonella enterica]|nr:hypothetical protein [Salmonella enterica]